MAGRLRPLDVERETKRGKYALVTGSTSLSPGLSLLEGR